MSPLPPALLREEVAQLQEEVHLLRQMKEMLTKDLEETHGSKSPEVLSATELKVQLAQKEQELARAKEALQGKGCASLFSGISPRDPKVARSSLTRKGKAILSIWTLKRAFTVCMGQGGGFESQGSAPWDPTSCCPALARGDAEPGWTRVQ